MICKWCGAAVSALDEACQRCKRPLPAMSDCGGFYDLVPNAPRPEPVEKPAAPAPGPKPEPAQPVSVRKDRDRFAPIRLAVTAALLLIFFVIQFASLARISTLEGQVRDLEEQVSSHQHPTQPAPSVPETTETTEPELTEPTESETTEPAGTSTADPTESENTETSDPESTEKPEPDALYL